MLNLHSKILNYISIILLVFLTVQAQNVFGESNNAKQDIVVKDYTWKSYGPTRPAILKDITLKNLSLTDYTNIEIEIDFYSKSGTPRGSIRGVVKEILPAGSEVTYNNIKFGIMNTILEDSTAKVVKAKEEGAGPISFVGRSIVIKEVEFGEAQFGTEAFIKKITLENKTDINYKNVKVKISDLGVQGAKVGYEGYVNKIKINKVIPANSTVTLENINIGFTHPDSKEKLVTVSEATPVSTKELKYLYGKQKDSVKITQGAQISEKEKRLSLVQRYRQSLKEKNIKVNDPGQPQSSSDKNEDGDMSFSIVEEAEEKVIAKKEIKEEIKVEPQPSPKVSVEKKIVEAKNKTPETKLPEFEEKVEDNEDEFISTLQPIEASEEIAVDTTENQNELIEDSQEKEANMVEIEETPQRDIVVKEEVETPEKIEIPSVNTEVASTSDFSNDSPGSPNSNSLSTDSDESFGNDTDSSGSDITFSDDEDLETASIRDYNVAFDDEVPLPKQDLVVKQFSWGSGIPGTLGRLRKLTLENISRIAYTDIDILVEYFSPTGIPLGSSQFKITEKVIAPNETKEFKNIDVGLVQLIPDESYIKISVRNAKDI